MDLQFDPIAKLSTTKLLSNAQDQGHTRFNTCNSSLYTKYTCNVGTTKAHVYQQTLGFAKKYTTVPKQPLNRPMALLENIHQYQNNLSTDLWLYSTGETK